MTSKVDISNTALANIHASSINSLTEASIEAQYCSLHFDNLLKSLLRMADWNFAQKQDALALSTVALHEWVYAYQYPSDCLRVNRLISQIEQISSSTNNLSYRPYYAYNEEQLYYGSINRYRVEYDTLTVGNDKLIGVNEPDVLIDYQYLVDDPNKWDSVFTQAFIWLLSANIALPIIGGDTGRIMRKDALTMYGEYLREAMALNANEGRTKQLESEITVARL